jgi:hypothetical protein
MTARKKPVAPLWWGRELFATGPEMGVPCPEVLDVTGRHRVLVFGPMEVLPAGRWRLTACFELSREAARNDYILQFIHGGELAEQTFRPSGPGRYEIALTTNFGQDAAAALRLWNARAVFHGELRFLGASVERQPD